MKYYLAKSLQNYITHSESFNGAGWTLGSSAYINGGSTSPRGDQSAYYMADSNTSDFSYIYTSVASFNAAKQYALSFYVGKDSIINRFPRVDFRLEYTNSSQIEYNIFILNTKTGDLLSSFASNNGASNVTDCISFWRVNVTAISSNALNNASSVVIYPAFTDVFSTGTSNVSLTGEVLLFGVQVTRSSGAAPYAATYSNSIVTSLDFVEINPEYNFEYTGKKIEDRKRARSGREYVYKWGQYDGRKFDVSYVSDADKTKINSWWSGNDSLLFVDGITTAITSVRIQNDKTPISKLEKPYTNLWQGMIELETY